MDLKPPFTEQQVLKENQFKCVRLLRDANGVIFVGKRYSGHKPQHLVSNAQYVYDTLGLFGDKFGYFASIPKVYGIDSHEHEVFLEYLPQLPTARLLDFSTLHRADEFFETCYTVRDKQGTLRSMKRSVYFTNRIASMLAAGFPVALGLKGDLWQNLCLNDQRLVLADIDSAALEPLGLSEFIMYAELLGSFHLSGLRYKFGLKSAQPVALRHLNIIQARQILTAALEIYVRRMGHIAPPVSKLKSTLVKRALGLSVERYYEPATH